MSHAEDDTEVLTLDLPADRRLSLAQLRRRIAAALNRLDEDHLQAVLLVATELVTNVYDHAAGPGRVRVRESRAPRRVRVDVDDDSPDLPVVGRSRLPGDRGRGLILIRALSHTWGTEARPTGGKTVWAVISGNGAG